MAIECDSVCDETMFARVLLSNRYRQSERFVVVSNRLEVSIGQFHSDGMCGW